MNSSIFVFTLHLTKHLTSTTLTASNYFNYKKLHISQPAKDVVQVGHNH